MYDAPPITDNADVKEFVNTLLENNINTIDFIALLRYVGGMEKQLDETLSQLESMRGEIEKMRYAQDHPVRNAMENAADSLEKQSGPMREKLGEIKAKIITGCQKALAAFKEKGISALNNTVEFLEIKQDIKNIKASFERCAKNCDKDVSRVTAASQSLHKAGMDIKNVGRAISGKEEHIEPKPMGTPAKAAITVLRTNQKIFEKAAGIATRAVTKLEDLEKAARKPSVIDSLNTNKLQIAETRKPALALPAPSRGPEL